MTDFASMRHLMVEAQLRTNKISDPPLLEAMAAVPRELFVPESMRGVAYADEDIPLGGGRFLVEPLALAKLIQSAEVRGGDVALVIGDATGYAAAVLCRFARQVHAMAQDEGAEGVLRELGCANVTLHQGDGAEGLPMSAPYDAIVLVGAVASVPPALLDQLREDGRLTAVVQERHGGKVTVFRKIDGGVGHRAPFDAVAPSLPQFQPKPQFVF